MRNIVFAVCVCFCVTGVWARTITVDDDGGLADFNDIQSAIDDANDYDVIVVADGNYTGANNKNLDFGGKLIILRSANGPNEAVIDCENDGRGFYFHNFETVEAKVNGFTITNGYVDSNDGGAILIEYSGPVIEDCFITNSFAHGGSGGGIYCYNADVLWLMPTISNCVIKNNRADWTGGGISAQNCNITVRNSVIASNNSNSWTGGIECFSNYAPNHEPIHTMNIINCTVTENNDVEGEGGISILYEADVLIANSIVYDNDGGQINEYSVTLAPTVQYSNVQGGYAGLGNIDVDPCFVDANSGDYHLKSQAGRWDLVLYRSSDLRPDGFVDMLDYAEFARFWHATDPNLAANLNRSGDIDWSDLLWFIEDYLTSPEPRSYATDSVTSRCIDAGSPGFSLGSEPFYGFNCRINIGAYGGTHQASGAPANWAVLADLNNDGLVNFADFAGFALYWLWDEPEVAGDLSRDGTVDIADLSLFAQLWLGSTVWH